MVLTCGSIAIIAISIFTMLLGKLFSMQGMSWYKKLKLPRATPPRMVYSIAWSIIFALTTVAAILVLQSGAPTSKINLIMFFFALNALLNVGWTWLFFNRKSILAALFDAVALLATIFVLMHLSKQVTCGAALLLIPYAVWVCYAIYLNDIIWQLNKPKNGKPFNFKDFFKKQSI